MHATSPLEVTPVTTIRVFILFSSLSTQAMYGGISKVAQISPAKEHLQFIIQLNI